MNILCVIPARGGSKRLPKKNLATVGGISLIERSADVLNGISEIKDILVSSDSDEIIEHAKNIDLMAPWIRPSELSNDEAKSTDVVLHALDWYEENIMKVDAVLLLQPTSPFRKKSSIKKIIKILKDNHCDSVISVSLTHSHPQWAFRYPDKYLEPFIEGDGINTRSQDLDPAYVVNGNIYLIKKDVLKNNNSFYSDKTIPYIMNDKIESIDIDTSDDLELANYYVDSGMWSKRLKDEYK